MMSTRGVGAMGLRQCLLETTRRVGDQGNDTQAILLVSGCGGKHRTREGFPMVQMTSVKEKEGCEGGRGRREDSKLHKGPIVYPGTAGCSVQGGTGQDGQSRKSPQLWARADD